MLVAFLFLATWIVSASNEAGWKFLEENAKKDGVITLASGMQYKVLNKGSGKFHPAVDSPCQCHYTGTLIDGTQFDSSYARGPPTTFAPNQVIKGWTEAMQLMVEGDKWELYIPSELAYGARGSPPKIPGDSVLIFTIEIIKINGEKIAAAKCDVFTYAECDEREQKWLKKITDKFWHDNEKYEQEHQRLSNLLGNKMKPELKKWVTHRLKLLHQFLVKPFETKEEL